MRHPIAKVIGSFVAANVVEGWLAKPHAKAGIDLKNSITPCIPLGPGLMAAVSPKGPIPMSDNPSLQASYFMDSLQYAATKPYSQGHESRVGIENPSTVVHIDEMPFEAFKNALNYSHTLLLAMSIGGWSRNTTSSVTERLMR